MHIYCQETHRKGGHIMAKSDEQYPDLDDLIFADEEYHPSER